MRVTSYKQFRAFWCRTWVGWARPSSSPFRGAAPNGVLVFLDGVPLNGAGGIADLSLVPAASLERVEAFGGTGSLFGSGALGGAVSLTTRDPEPGLHLLGEVTAGSFGTEAAQVSVAGSVPGGTARLVVNGLHTDGEYHYLYNPFTPLPIPPALYTRDNSDATLGEALLSYRAQAGAWHLKATAEGMVDARGSREATRASSPPTDRQHTQREAVSFQASRDLDVGATAARARIRPARGECVLRSRSYTPSITQDYGVGERSAAGAHGFWAVTA